MNDNEWVGSVACTGQMRNVYILVERLEGKRHLEDLGMNGNNIKMNHKYSLSGVTWIRTGISGGSCEHDNGPSGSINIGEFVDQLSNS
jgi:hypothetical protein